MTAAAPPAGVGEGGRSCGEPGPFVVLDDDPTGAQATADVTVIIDLEDRVLHDWLKSHRPRPVYVLTNSRALAATEAQDLVATIANLVAKEWPDARLVLRGDSTLRAHLAPEYLGASLGSSPVLLLVPAMPSAGRLTIGGAHYLVHDGQRVPLQETEYAADPDLGYNTSNLLSWAEERSGGLFPAKDGRVVGLGELRSTGAAAVPRAVELLASLQRPVACAVDAETDEDIEQIAEGVRLACRKGLPLLVRCAPPLAAALTGGQATRPAKVPQVDGPVLVVSASYVPLSSAQLEAYEAAFPGTTVVADVEALLARPAIEQARLAKDLSRRLGCFGVAAVVTPRARPRSPVLPRGASVVRALAQVLHRLSPRPSVVLAKGGVTAAVVARDGLGACTAYVRGPLRAGVSLWELATREGERLPFVVFPGNVGSRSTLAEVVSELLGGRVAGGAV
jgi:uncharacterized protein YgbK (DUF1537 family)